MAEQPLEVLLREAERVLTDSGVWSPREDAEALAAHVLDLTEGSLKPERPVSEDDASALRALVGRRAARIPLGHLTGRARLGGIEVTVTEDVFVPRFPTELLLAWGLSAVEHIEAPVVVDLCTGSGAVALAFAHMRSDAGVHAVDLDPGALACARRNAADRAREGDTPVTVHQGDVADAALLAALDGGVDLVLANPPYVPVGTELLPEWGRHHPRQAIFGGDDGLRVIRQVIGCAARLLRPGGALAIEHGDGQIGVVLTLLAESGVFEDIAGHHDQENRPRYTTTLRRSSCMTAPSTAGEAGLVGLRHELDLIDAKLLDTLKDRIECCIRIAEHKREHAVPMMQPHRIGVVQERASRFGSENGIDQGFLRRLYELIIDETCRVEDLVIADTIAAEQPVADGGL